MLKSLGIAHELMQLTLEGDIWAAARVLGLEVPGRLEEGTVEVAPGVGLEYYWGSVDGRATEWLRLSCAFDAIALEALVSKLVSSMRVGRRSDLQVAVTSRQLAV